MSFAMCGHFYCGAFLGYFGQKQLSTMCDKAVFTYFLKGHLKPFHAQFSLSLSVSITKGYGERYLSPNKHVYGTLITIIIVTGLMFPAKFIHCQISVEPY